MLTYELNHVWPFWIIIFSGLPIKKKKQFAMNLILGYEKANRFKPAKIRMFFKACKRFKLCSAI